MRLPGAETRVPDPTKILLLVNLALDIPVLANPVIAALDGSCKTDASRARRKRREDRIVVIVESDMLRNEPSTRETGRLDSLQAEQDVGSELRCWAH